MKMNPKTRFDIFKRDSFQCQYCGKSPPTVILEVDHVIARASGGPDEIDNLITSCFECNRGKGKASLETLPETLASKLEIIKVRREQLKAYKKYISDLEKTIQSDIDDIGTEFQIYFPGHSFSESFKKSSLHNFLRHLTTNDIKEALAISVNHHPNKPDTATRYMCGICWNWIKYPETRGRL